MHCRSGEKDCASPGLEKYAEILPSNLHDADNDVVIPWNDLPIDYTRDFTTICVEPGFNNHLPNNYYFEVISLDELN